LIWLRIGQLAGYCECGNEPLGSIKCGEFLDWLRPLCFSGRTVLEGVSLFVNNAGSWPMNRVSIPGRSKKLFLYQSVRAGGGAHPASY